MLKPLNPETANHASPPPEAERLDVFMARANARYYATHPLLSDFITAPEISQVFGELLGAWAAMVWVSMGRPNRIILAEAGPGRGTLMADALRLISKQVPAFAQSLEMHLIETSPLMRKAQQAALARYTHPTWHDTLESLPDGPMILLANEFLDALPIRQFEHTPKDGWQERYVQGASFCLAPCPHQFCQMAEHWKTTAWWRFVNLPSLWPRCSASASATHREQPCFLITAILPA